MPHPKFDDLRRFVEGAGGEAAPATNGGGGTQTPAETSRTESIERQVALKVAGVVVASYVGQGAIKPEEFGDIVIRSSGPSGVLRLKDVARIELDAANYDAFTTLVGKPTAVVALAMTSHLPMRMHINAPCVWLMAQMKCTVIRSRNSNWPDTLQRCRKMLKCLLPEEVDHD
jgi:hypothetical protein